MLNLRFAGCYAFRNLWRHTRRTALTVLAVLFAVAMAIIANRYSTAVIKLWQDGAADTGAAHAQLHAAGYWKKSEGVQESLTIAENDASEQHIRHDPAVAASVRRLELEGIISAGEQSLYFIGIGVEPNHELAVSPRLFTGHDVGQFVSERHIDGVTIGKGLAESLDLNVGDEATLITQTVQGSVNGIDVKVIGIVDAAIPSFSQRVVYANIGYLQKLIRMPGRYTELAVKLRSGNDIEAWVKAQRPTMEQAGKELRGWWDIEPVINNVGRIWTSVVVAITALLFLSAALSVLNIIFMMVAERRIEIGTLMAIGARPQDVRFLFSLEGLLIGIFGGIGGAAVGNGVVFLLDVIGVPFASPFGTEQLVIHPKVNGLLTFVVVGGAILICYLSAIVPARRASRLEPVRAFRGQH